ncbi:MAG: hypothetical protein R6V77_05030 [Candidatus Cloacimonadaceae bacterium]
MNIEKAAVFYAAAFFFVIPATTEDLFYAALESCATIFSLPFLKWLKTWQAN